MRKLVTVRPVDAIEPIEGADAIELIHFGGWQCVSKKGEFTVGSLAVYFEIDSFLPFADQRYAFLHKNAIKWQEKEGMRIKSIKLRGALSQGIALPIELFPEVKFAHEITPADADGEPIDYADMLGVEKWERTMPASLGGVARGNFPSFLRKSDQERIQNCSRLLAKAVGKIYERTMKMDGSSGTYYLHDDVFGACSRNLDLVETEGNSFWNMARKYKLEERMRAVGMNFALQGEVVGGNIQGNWECIPEGEIRFYVFDVWDTDKQKFLPPLARYAVIDALNSIALDSDAPAVLHVPIINRAVTIESIGDIAAVLAAAEGKGLYCNIREGDVYKDIETGEVSFKAVSNLYLLKGGN